ncbi:MAG: PQQ-binding-like beta-propeller repeat protein [Acidobacteriota bacterium]
MLQRAPRVCKALWIHCIALLLCAAPAAADWASFRGDSSLTGRADAALPERLEPLWTFQVDDGFFATAALVDGKVYAPALDGVLYVLDQATGSELWSYRAKNEIKSSPLVREGVVYFGDESGVLHAVDAETGGARWTFEAGAAVTSSPNLAGGCLLFGAYDNNLYCLDPASGKERWKVETQSYVHATPAVFDNSEVLIAGCDGALRRVRLKDGEELGSTSLGGYAAASPAITEGVAVVGTFENQVLAVEVASGEVRWTYENPERAFPYYASAAIAGDRAVVAGRDKAVRALSLKDGSELWKRSFRARLDASPVVAGERAYIAGQDGSLHALGLASGEVAWQFETGSAFDASPAIADGRLVIGSADGTLYCFGTQSSSVESNDSASRDKTRASR